MSVKTLSPEKSLWPNCKITFDEEGKATHVQLNHLVQLSHLKPPHDSKVVTISLPAEVAQELFKKTLEEMA